jgi:putative ABC transport system permease protein
MTRYALRILVRQPVRLTLTIGGIALCIVLMMFLLSVYEGVADGCLEYIRQNECDLWVLHRSSNNIMRTSSVLPATAGESIRQIPGVASVSPVLLMLATVHKESRSSTVYLTGFDAASGIGGPPHLAEGRSVRDDGEIVLDCAYTARMGYAVGDDVVIQDDTLQVVGICKGTNAFVIQYAFVTLSRARQTLGVSSIVTCYLVTTAPYADRSDVTSLISDRLPMAAVYDHATFLAHNTREMQAGFLPFVFTVAAIGVVVLTVIISLLLVISILEQRYDFAIIKALGAPRSFLPCLLIEQGLILTSTGFALAMILLFPMTALVQYVTPEIATQSSLRQMVLIAVTVAVLGLIGSFISLQRLRRIYPLEAFS